MPRPDDLLGLRFDTVADRYHHVRPRYPYEIWNALFDTVDLPAGARVLEIGAGTGVATAELVRRGFHVTALEPGAAMAAMIERDLGDTGRVEVVVSRFDEWGWNGEPFDLVIGATSLHWIDRVLLQERLPSLVRPEGFAALLHYLHVAGGDMAFFEQVQACYAAHEPNYREHRLRSPDEPANRSWVIDDLPGFEPTLSTYWLVDVPSDREHYLSLISTYSTSLSMPEPQRTELFQCIGDLIDDRFGGRIVKMYRFDLVITRRNL